MYNVLPLFKSHFSIGRSILTLDKDAEEDFPDSIVDIATKTDMKKVFLVDDNMSGFLQAYTNTKEANLDLVFGIRMNVCGDMQEKDEDSLKKTCKYIIAAKNTNGYERLIKIFSIAAKEGFYYKPRIDFKTLKEMWDENDLQMMIPFYDSFIFNNIMGYANCIPDFTFTEPVFLEESNSLPFDGLIKEKADTYCKGKFQQIMAQSIYYNLKKDFKSYLTFRCINSRTSLDKPNLDHMGSNEFCIESWREKNGTI